MRDKVNTRKNVHPSTTHISTMSSLFMQKQKTSCSSCQPLIPLLSGAKKIVFRDHIVSASLRCDSSASRSFTSTSALCRISTQRKNLYIWLQRHGKRFVGAPQRPSNYLGPLTNQPFPMNPLFRSQPVLSEETREEIWHQVVNLGSSLKAVSAVLNVDIIRVAAVVRMKQIEKQRILQVRARGFS
jgi:hypothetical protein